MHGDAFVRILELLMSGRFVELRPALTGEFQIFPFLDGKFGLVLKQRFEAADQTGSGGDFAAGLDFAIVIMGSGQLIPDASLVLADPEILDWAMRRQRDLNIVDFCKSEFDRLRIVSVFCLFNDRVESLVHQIMRQLLDPVFCGSFQLLPVEFDLRMFR